MRVRYLRRTRCRMRTGVAAGASLDGLEAAIRTVEARLGETLAPFRVAVERLITMPGVSQKGGPRHRRGGRPRHDPLSARPAPNFVRCSIGRSAGFAPFRIRSTNVEARRYIYRKSSDRATSGRRSPRRSWLRMSPARVSAGGEVDHDLPVRVEERRRQDQGGFGPAGCGGVERALEMGRTPPGEPLHAKRERPRRQFDLGVGDPTAARVPRKPHSREGSGRLSSTARVASS